MVHSLLYLDFVNTPPSYNLDYFHKLVVENGGSFSMNLNDSVTHCIAAEKKGIPLVQNYSFFLFRVLSTYSLDAIFCTFRYQISGSHMPRKDHSLFLDLGLFQAKTSSSFAT